MSSIRSNLPGAPDPSDAWPTPSAHLAAQLRPLRAMLGRNSHGVVLDLDPIAPAALAAAWYRTAPDEYALTLALEPDDPPVTADDRGRIVGRVLHDAGVRRHLAGELRAGRLLVRVDGPIEAGDAEAIRTAHRRGSCVLGAEVRAVVAVVCDGRQGIAVHARELDVALTFLAEALRQHVAGIRRVDPRSVPVPEIGLVRRLVERTGQLSIRPIETEVFATAIDIGVSTAAEEGRPADASVIYDLFSGTWHGD